MEFRLRTLVFLLACLLLPVYAYALPQELPVDRSLKQWERELEALIYGNEFRKALSYADSMEARLSNETDQQRLDFFRAKVFLNQDEYEKSLALLVDALSYFRENGPAYYQARTCKVLALWKVRHGYPREALQYYQEALELLQELDRPNEESKVQGNMAILYHAQGKTEKAKNAFRAVIHIARAHHDSVSLSTGYLNLQRAFLYEGSLDSAEYYNRMARVVALGVNDSLLWADALRGKAELLEGRGRADSAAEVWKTTIDLYRSRDQKRRSLHSYESLVANLEARGLYEEANQYLRTWAAVKDSVYIAERQKAIAMYEDELKTAGMEHELKLMTAREKTERKQKYLYLTLSALALLAIVLVVMKWHNQRKLRRKEAEVYRKNLKLEGMERAKLQDELEVKQRSLTKESLRIVQKNRQLGELQQKLNSLNQKLNPEARSEWVSINSAIKYALNVDKEWEEFSHYFEDIHPDFIKALDEVEPQLTQKEKRLCALLKINMTTREAASVLGISPASVKKARNRLRKKLNLAQDEDLLLFLVRLVE